MNKKIPLWRAILSICLIILAVATFAWAIFDHGLTMMTGTPSPVTTSTISTSSTVASGTITTSSTTISGTTSTGITIPTFTLPTPIVVSNSDMLARKFGISTGDTLPGMSDLTLAKELNDIASLGVGWIRMDFAWNDIQPDNSYTYNWAGIDRVVAAANARNIKVLAILDYTPAWARSSACPPGNSRCGPSDPALFATFAAAAVQRYAPKGVSDWEIWNEPNSKGFWEPETNPNNYTMLLRAAYVAIKNRDAAATVITGGLSPAASTNGSLSPTDFLTRVYADGGKGYFDEVGDHPYSYPVVPLYTQSWNAWSQMASTTPSLRSIMIANGDGNKQIWMTEYGAPTGGPGLLATVGTTSNYGGHPDHVTEALQATMMTQAIITTENLTWTGPLFWYSYKDLGTSTNTSENFFGIIRYDGSTKPAYSVLKALLE